MGCDEFIAAIGESAVRQRNEILAHAEQEAQALILQAESHRPARIETARTRGAAAARREGSRIESRARIAAKREVLAARYEVIELVLRALEERLRSLAGTRKHRDVLDSLLAECLADDPTPIAVRCRPEDREAVQDCVHRRRMDLAVVEAPLPLGGVETISGVDGTRVFRNGFADRIEKIRPQLLLDANRLLFGPPDGARRP